MKSRTVLIRAAHRGTARRGPGPFTLALLASLVVVAAFGPLAAQESAEAEPAGERAVQRDPYDITVPRGAVHSFIDRCRDGDYAGAAELMDLRRVADGETQGSRLARRLKVVLDRELWIHYDLISDQPNGELDDGLAPSLESLGQVGEVEILLERTPGADGVPIWRFSAATVAAVPALYDEYGYGVLGEYLPAGMFELRLFEVQAWQWIAMLVLFIAAWVVAWLVMQLMYLVARPLVARSRSDADDRVLLATLGPARFLVTLALFALGTVPLRLAEPVYRVLLGMEKAAAVVAICWLVLRLIDLAAALIGEHLDRVGQPSARAVLPLGRRTLKFVVLAVAVMAVFQNLGFNVTSLITGLGIGGLAVALAAQQTLSNLFGGVTLVTDQPVRVGDFCRFGDKVGTVEEIGLRSTRLRTLDRTVVSVPNSQFSEIQLENFARRDRIRLLTLLSLRYETTPDQMRYVLAELRRVLFAHPKISNDPARVRFIQFGGSSLDVEVMAFATTADWNEFLSIREQLFLSFMDVVRRAGSGFAFPSQTLYLGRDNGLDDERQKQAEQQVEAWRQERRLPFPDFSPELVAEVDGKSPWPPTGSAVAAAQESGPGTDESR